jgi:hypothetical protein
MTPAIFEELWESSPVKGSSLLLLLAIARYANHDGTGAYPSLATLKRLTRLSHSQVCLLLRQLAEEGHLRVMHGGGPGGTNAYTIVRTWDKQGIPKIGHAKTAHAIAHPKIGHNQEPKEKEKISVASSDVRKSDMRESETPRLTPGGAQFAAMLARSQVVKEDFAHIMRGESATRTSDITPSPPTKPARGHGTYFLGKLCKRGHDYEGTGQSLRRLPSAGCHQCNMETQEARRQAKVQASRAARPPRRVIDLATHRQRQA